MSGLFNLKVNNVAAEDITLNGQTVEEVWVDGVQVFDAYDPTTIPDGTLATRGSTHFGNYVPTSYTSAEITESLQGKIGKKGSVTLNISNVNWDHNTSGIGGQEAAEHWARLGKQANCYISSPLFYMVVQARPVVSDYGGGSQVSVTLKGLDTGSEMETIWELDDGHVGTLWVKYEWDFEQRKCWLTSDRYSRQQYNLTKKWKAEEMNGSDVSVRFTRSTASSTSYNGDTAKNCYIYFTPNLDIRNS